ncbi:hypothetical protein CA11_53190 [Gimesia maris]|uniref:DUF4145 domain-containing protein n=1 Tax=Gimesia maris TaxID=122 RepID=UPI0011888B65|nr:DUF4145 domain-containing protein [Gimesia maris]QDU17477.1 hypothetical protein CA11_53190 [Gimesia maris]
MSDLSEVLICGHCGNSSPMNIVAKWTQHLPNQKTKHLFSPLNGCHYETLICMTCEKPTFRSVVYDDRDKRIEIYYPKSVEISFGLPEVIHRAYEAARKARNVDANAFAVMLGRLLELVCKDQKAEGKNLFQKLNDLSEKGTIPDKLSKIAQGLREHRNIGAHAELGELTEEDAPLLEKLTHAILEYVYTAPALAIQAEKQLAKLKGK